MFAGLPLRGRMGSWYLTNDVEVEVELAPIVVVGYGETCEACEWSTGECDERGV